MPVLRVQRICSDWIVNVPFQGVKNSMDESGGSVGRRSIIVVVAALIALMALHLQFVTAKALINLVPAARSPMAPQSSAAACTSTSREVLRSSAVMILVTEICSRDDQWPARRDLVLQIDAPSSSAEIGLRRSPHFRSRIEIRISAARVEQRNFSTGRVPQPMSLVSVSENTSRLH